MSRRKARRSRFSALTRRPSSKRRTLAGLACLAVLSGFGCPGSPATQGTLDGDTEPEEPLIPWAIDGDTPHRSYPVVGPQDRFPISLNPEVETLVDGADSAIGRPMGTAIDDDGNIYVADAQRNRIAIFAPDGGYSGAMGRQGPGPGEFSELGPITIAAGTLAAIDTRSRRISIWDLQTRELISDRALWRGRRIYYLDGTLSGQLVGSFTRIAEDKNQYRDVVRLAPNGSQELLYVNFLLWARPTATVPGESTLIYSVPVGTPEGWYAVSPEGDVYLAPGDEYRILAVDGDGNQKWAISVPWPRERVTSQEIRAGEERLLFIRPELPDSAVAQVSWRSLNPALSRQHNVTSNGESLRVDGLGFLYVFPHIPLPWETDERERPVDVYSPDGLFLFGGVIPNVNWRVARGDYILALDTDTSGEWIGVKYRMVWPAEFRYLRDDARRASGS